LRQTVFELGFNLYRGKYIYIDDLFNATQARKKGYASQLLDWVLKYAKDNGYNQVQP
jgi:GNAT superfamily N-acetyltransferase